MVILEGRMITKVYENQGKNSTFAVNGVDLRINKGDFTAVMGPSGSGKTTLLNLLSGIVRPSSGCIEFLGRDLNSLRSSDLAEVRRRNMGFVFQDYNLMDSLTLKENILLPMILEKKAINYMEEVCETIIDSIGIKSIEHKYPYNVSGGEQQKTAIARALANEPDIIFADEPTGNLDSKSSQSVMKCFQTINEERNSTVFMVTHDVFAASFCRKVIFIKDGCIHSEIVKKRNNKEFFYEILDSMAVLGGVSLDI